MEKTYKLGYIFYYTFTDGDAVACGGLDDSKRLSFEKTDYGEFVLRSLVNECLLTGVTGVTATDEWGIDLTAFGFKKTLDGSYYAEYLCLPLCGGL